MGGEFLKRHSPSLGQVHSSKSSLGRASRSSCSRCPQCSQIKVSFSSLIPFQRRVNVWSRRISSFVSHLLQFIQPSLFQRSTQSVPDVHIPGKCMCFSAPFAHFVCGQICESSAVDSPLYKPGISSSPLMVSSSQEWSCVICPPFLVILFKSKSI